MSKLFASLENDELTVPGEQSEAKAELELLEHDEIVKNVLSDAEASVDVLDETVEAMESLVAIQNKLIKVVNSNKGLTSDASKLASISTERICDILGYKRTNKAKASLEAFVTDSSLKNTKVALEFVGDVLTKVWTAIKDFFVRIWEHIKKLWNVIFNNVEAKKTNVVSMRSRLNAFIKQGFKPATESFSNVFRGKEDKVLKLQNAFRTEESAVIKNNIKGILSNHENMISYDEVSLEPIEVDRKYPSKKKALEVLRANVESFDTYFKSIKDKSYIDGYTVVTNSNGSKYTDGLKSTIPSTKAINEENLVVADSNTLLDLLDDVEDLIMATKDMQRNGDEYRKAFESYIKVSSDKLAEVKNVGDKMNPIDPEFNVMSELFIASQVAANTLFITIPSLTLKAIDSGTEYINMHMSLYEKA